MLQNDENIVTIKCNNAELTLKLSYSDLFCEIEKTKQIINYRFKMGAKLYTLLLLMLLLSSSVFELKADDLDTNEVKRKLPLLASNSNAGKEYWFSIPPCYQEESGGFANFVRIFIICPKKTNVIVEVPGAGFFKQLTTNPNGLAVVDISPEEAQPFLHNGLQDKAPPAQIYKGKGIHVLANDPIVVYVAVRFKYTADGFLAIPVSGLGKEYVTSSVEDPGFAAGAGNHFAPWVNITTPFDNTSVVFTMGGLGGIDSKAVGTGGRILRAGQSETVRMNKGDVIVYSIAGNFQDITGSKIIANKPISVVSGHHCAQIPRGTVACDYIVEMELPAKSWGRTILVPKIPGRRYSGLVRMFASEPNTDIYRNGSYFTTVKTFGGVDNIGWVENRVWPREDPTAPKPAVFTSDKPFYIMYGNTGAGDEGPPYPVTDPFIMAMTPVEQFQNEITFCTPNAAGGELFSVNYLNVVIEADNNRLMPADFEFGVFKQEWEWQPVRSMSGLVENFAPFKMYGDTATKYYVTKNLTLPLNGVFKLRCKSRKFASYSFGYGNFDSYGYPTSVALADLTLAPDPDAPEPLFTIDCDGTVVGKVTDKPDDPTIRSGLGMVYMQQDSSYNYTFTYTDFEPGKNAISTNWKLTVDDPREDAMAILHFIDAAGNDTTVIISNVATKLDITPKTIDFGLFKEGESASNTYTLTNLSKKVVLVDTMALWRQNQGFKIEPLGWSMSVPFQINESRPIKVTFTYSPNLPKNTAIFLDSLGVGDSCRFFYLAEMQAKTGAPQILAGDYTFAPYNIRNTNPLQTEIRVSNNSETSDLIITSASALSNTFFTTSFKFNEVTASNPIVVPKKGFFTFNAFFKPTVVGNFSDSIVFTSDATGPDNITYLNGPGILANLAVNYHDWKEVRVSRPAFPIAKKDGVSSDGSKVLTFKNTGNTDNKIENMVVITASANDAAGDINSFILDDNKTPVSNFIGKFGQPQINQNDSVVREVYFLPTTTGKHKATLSFAHQAGAPVISVIEGVGILPRVDVTPSIAFGSTIVDDLKGVKKGTIKITNPVKDATGWEFGDTLNITSITAPGNEVAYDFNSWGTKGFRINLNSVKNEAGATINLAGYKLAPGNSIFIDAEFVAKSTNAETSVLTLNSDADLANSTITTTLTGSGLTQGIGLQIESGSICVGRTQTLNAVFTNTGDVDLIISNVTENRTDNDINISDLSGTFIVPAKVGMVNGTVTKKIEFSPQRRFANEQVTITYKVNIDGDSIKTSNFNLTGLKVDVSTISKDYRASNNKIEGEYGAEELVNYGNQIGYKIIVLPSPQGDISIAGLDKFDVAINYPASSIRPIIDNVNANRNTLKIEPTFANDFTIDFNTLSLDINKGSISFTVNANNGKVLSTSGELISLVFSSYFPSFSATQTNQQQPSKKFEITHSLNELDNRCFSYENHEPTRVNMEQICADLLRVPTVGLGNFALGAIAPNPVDSKGADVNFSIAFDCDVEIRIINSNSEVVAMPINGASIKAGEYKFGLPINNLSNGVYFIEMKAGNHFNQVQKLIIEK